VGAHEDGDSRGGNPPLYGRYNEDKGLLLLEKGSTTQEELKAFPAVRPSI